MCQILLLAQQRLKSKKIFSASLHDESIGLFYYGTFLGGVPIVTTPTENTNQNEYIVPRNTIEETFAFIKSDLELALNNFPDDTNNKVQLSKSAANALKADVFYGQPNN